MQAPMANVTFFAINYRSSLSTSYTTPVLSTETSSRRTSSSMRRGTLSSETLASYSGQERPVSPWIASRSEATSVHQDIWPQNKSATSRMTSRLIYSPLAAPSWSCSGDSRGRGSTSFLGYCHVEVERVVKTIHEKFMQKWVRHIVKDTTFILSTVHVIFYNRS